MTGVSACRPPAGSRVESADRHAARVRGLGRLEGVVGRVRLQPSPRGSAGGGARRGAARGGRRRSDFGNRYTENTIESGEDDH